LRKAQDDGRVDRPDLDRTQKRCRRWRCGSLPCASLRKPPRPRAARPAARRSAKGYQVSQQTLVAADWVDPGHLADGRRLSPPADVLALYRLSWRIELGFSGQKRDRAATAARQPTNAPPGPYVLAHLLLILLLERSSTRSRTLPA